MRSICFIYAIFISVFSFLPVKSQNLRFHHFTTDEGLSHNSVISIYQDERNFMWLGTRDGLNLYDGKEFKTYKYQKNNPNSLLNNNIYQITGDGKGKVFCMTNSGITAYDIEKDIFMPIVTQQTSAVYFNEYLYFASQNQIYRYREDSIQLIYRLPEEASITHLHEQGDSLWIGTADAGLYLLENKYRLSHIIPQGRIYDLFCDSEGWLWVTSHDGQGIFVIKDGKIERWRHSPIVLSSISSDQTHVCCEDENGDVWIGTFDGLNKYNKKTKEFTRYYHKQEKNSLSESSVWSLFCDHQGNIWAGTYYGGVNVFNPSRQIYSTYNVSMTEADGLSSPTVGQITEDKHQNLWICTEGGGICAYNLLTGTFRWYKHNQNVNSLSHNHAKTVYYDAVRNVVWIGTHLGGLNKLDLKTGRFTHYMHRKDDSFSLPSDIVMDIQPYGDELLLAAIGGVTLFNPQTGQCRPFFTDSKQRKKTSFCVDLFIDCQNVLWMADLSRGLFAYHPETRKMTEYQYEPQNPSGISNDKINSIYEDSRHTLWLSTNGGGLMSYHRETDSFENYDMASSGLSSNVIYSIGELSDKRLVVTTDNGFSILDSNYKQFTNYDRQKDIPLTSINENSLYCSTTGEVFVGGMNGMLSFREKDLNTLPKAYSIYPCHLFVNGQAVATGDETGILTENITTVQEITLPAQYSVFTLGYTVTDYIPFRKDELIYRLEGFSDAWMRLSGQKTITYTNLHSGTYTLVVKSISKQGDDIQESRIRIHILPPFYKTWWAYLIYLIVLITLLWYLIRSYSSRIKLRETLKYEQKHIQDVEELNQMKLRFFTNISHEFRTPLAIIIGRIEILLENPNLDKYIQSSIFKVYKSCLQLKELISELLDFRKQEQGYMTIKVREHDVVGLLYEHFLLFQDYASKQQINYSFVHVQDEIKGWLDAKQMRKVMNNLIFNAFKYTPCGGKIIVSIRKENQEIVIEVTDNGTGIKAEDIDKIFNRFYQGKENDSAPNGGTGIGLALSKGIVELHHGSIEVYSEQGTETTFRIRLLMGNKHFSSEEIESSENENQEPLKNIQLPESIVEEMEQTDSESGVLENQNLVTKDCKLLIVEDDSELRGMLIGLFSSFYTVLAAADGEEGWRLVENEMPDIVVSDIVMPGMSGMELCKAIKENIATCHIPIVLLTARTAIESTLEALKTGADDYITKPFNVQFLLSRCNNLVNSRIMMQEKFSKQPQATHRILANNEMDKEFIDKAIGAVRKHLGNPDFSMDVFAQEVGIARTNLFIKLKAVSGQTPADFILTIRLKEATLMLKNNSGLSIMEISDRLGFSSPKYFRKCFKDKYHVTPQEYRRGGLE